MTAATQQKVSVDKPTAYGGYNEIVAATSSTTSQLKSLSLGLTSLGRPSPQHRTPCTFYITHIRAITVRSHLLLQSCVPGVVRFSFFLFSFVCHCLFSLLVRPPKNCVATLRSLYCHVRREFLYCYTENAE